MTIAPAHELARSANYCTGGLYGRRGRFENGDFVRSKTDKSIVALCGIVGHEGPSQNKVAPSIVLRDQLFGIHGDRLAEIQEPVIGLREVVALRTGDKGRSRSRCDAIRRQGNGIRSDRLDLADLAGSIRELSGQIPDKPHPHEAEVIGNRCNGGGFSRCRFLPFCLFLATGWWRLCNIVVFRVGREPQAYAIAVTVGSQGTRLQSNAPVDLPIHIVAQIDGKLCDISPAITKSTIGHAGHPDRQVWNNVDSETCHALQEGRSAVEISERGRIGRRVIIENVQTELVIFVGLAEERSVVRYLPFSFDLDCSAALKSRDLSAADLNEDWVAVNVGASCENHIPSRLGAKDTVGRPANSETPLDCVGEFKELPRSKVGGGGLDFNILRPT